jgi:hypothetical protein
MTRGRGIGEASSISVDREETARHRGGGWRGTARRRWHWLELGERGDGLNGPNGLG